MSCFKIIYFITVFINRRKTIFTKTLGFLELRSIVKVHVAGGEAIFKDDKSILPDI